MKGRCKRKSICIIHSSGRVYACENMIPSSASKVKYATLFNIVLVTELKALPWTFSLPLLLQDLKEENVDNIITVASEFHKTFRN